MNGLTCVQYLSPFWQYRQGLVIRNYFKLFETFIFDEFYFQICSFLRYFLKNSHVENIFPLVSHKEGIY